ncbi:hypothetical protein CA54_27570 [Symmachiella macrocystis]|uniref:Uncharacterized protein n=1 Tax=Symmachiella macrocystis TaxID=2527985 RepID=A0A5C6BPF5_9PLAN|nr:hypothetical protein [Symmachiella macrocystis]TWU13915.1 hypothetical protein CA54_27570 [Symmachiella macrocystis]
MTTLRYSGVVHSLLGLGMLLLACGWENSSLLFGQESEAAVPNIQWNLVPLNKRSVWPPGDWQPIRRDRLKQQHTKDGKPAAQVPREFPIRHAVYSAKLTSENALDGGLVLKVDQPQDGPAMIPLDPLSLPVHDLTWPNGEAVWGSTPQGQLVVKSHSDQKTLTGRWKLRGEKRPGGFLFDVQVAQAAASQLMLTVPETYDVQCETAVVDAPVAADVPGWRKWRIELGRQTRCRVVLYETEPDEKPAPLIVLSDNRVKYTSAPEQFRIQNRMQLDILKAPLSDLEFVTDSDVQIHAVLAGAAALPMEQHITEGRRTVRVHFDPPISGPGHVLQLQATAPLTTERQIQLPRILVPGAVVGGGRIDVIVPAPFELQKITTPPRYRQEDASSGGNAVAFHYYGAAGNVTAVFGWPRAEVSCRIFSHLRSTRDQWEAQTQMQWQCQSGQRFTLQCEFPSEWDITVVSLQNSSGRFVTAEDWTIVPGARDTRTLVVKLSESLSATNPVTMEFIAMRPMTAHHEPLAIPAPVPLNTEDVETLVSVAETSSVQPMLQPGTTFSPMSRPRVSPAWQQFSLWETAKQTDRSSQVFLSTAARPQGQFLFQSDQTPLNIAAKVQMELFEDRAQEDLKIIGRATGPAVSQVLVFVNEPGPKISWELPEDKETKVTPRRLTTSRQLALGLPRFGELWEIEFTPPTVSFTLVGSRSRAFSASGQAPLVSVPRAESFQGTVEVESPPEIQPRFIPQDLVELQEVDASPGNNPSAAKVQRWSYRAVDARLRIETQVRSSGSPAAAISSVDIHSHLSPAADGENRHWAVVDLTALSETAELEWTLPESALPGSVRVGDQTVEPYRVRESFRLQRGTRDQTGMAVIHYRTPSVPQFGPGIIQTPVPKFNVPVLRFSWTVVCPPRTQIQILNLNARPYQAAIGDSWSRRFLGPLAQQPASSPSQNAEENPILNRSLDQGEAGTGTAIPDAPSGWQPQTFEFAMSPVAISAAMWDVDRSRFIAVALLMSCLIIAAGIRACGLNFSRRFVIVWLLLCVVIATWVPTAYAEIAGGIVIGSLLACLIPLVEKIIVRDSSRPEEPVSMGSTRKYIPVATAIVMAALCLSRTMAQESTTTRRSTQPELHRVLIPYEPGDPLGRNAKWVYVEPHTLAALSAGQPDESAIPPYLFRSARYDLAVTRQGGSQCDMRFDVDVLATSDDVTIQLPLENVNLLADDPCRVNGKPHPVWRDAVTGNLSLRLSGPKPIAEQSPAYDAANTDGESASPSPQHVRYRIDLSTTIANVAVENHNNLRWNIPRVANSLLSVRLPADQTFARIGLDQRPPFMLQLKNETEPEVISVGNAEHVDVVSSAEVIPSAGRVTVSAVCLADVTPSLIQYQAQISYRVRQGFVNHLLWKLPPDIAVRSIHGKNVAGFHVLNKQQMVVVELDSLSSDPIEILADFVLPIADESHEPVVPALDFRPQEQLVEDSMSPVQIFAVTAPSEFELEIQPADTNMAASLEKSNFLQRWKGNAAQPRAVYAIEGSVDFETHLQSLAPKRNVKTVFQGRISRHHLNWELTAEMDVRTALAFQHRMQIDPRLRIESISIQQADAERLRRATRTRDQLVLFLKTGATGNQTIRIKGAMSLKFPGEFTLPAIGFFDANLTDAEVVLWQENDLEVQLTGIDENLPVPDRTAWELVNDSDLLVGRYQIPTGTDMEQVVVKIDKNSPDIVMDAVNLLDMRVVGIQKMTTVLRFQVASGHASEFSVRLPKQFADTCEVISPASTRKELRDDGLELTFLPDDPRQQEMVARLNFPIELDKNGELVIDEIFPINATVGEVFVQTLTDEESFGPAAEYSGLTEEELPAQFADWIPVETPAAYSKSYRGGAGPWRFRNRNSPSQDALTIELADTRLWLDHARGLVGHTSYLILPGNKEQLDVTLPAGAKLRAVLTDHGLATVSQVSGQDITITLDSAQVGQMIMLYWTRPAADHNLLTDFYRRMNVPTPQPQHFVVKQSAMTVIPAAHIGLEGAGDDLTPLKYALLRLDAEFTLCRAQTNAGHPRLKFLWNRLEAHYQQVAHLFDQDADELTGDDAAQLRTEFAKLQQRITNQLRQLPSLEIPVLAIDDTPISDPTLSDIVSPYGSLHEFDAMKSRQATNFSTSVFDERLAPAIATVIGILLVAMVRYILRRHIEFDTIAWLIDHPRIAWTAVGLFWWQFMSPSWLGPAIVVIAIISRFYPRQKAANASTELDFVVGTSSSA